MPNTLCTLEQSTFFSSSILEVKREQQGVPRRRWSRITLGFWLGGILFGTAGCILGASLSYHHPVARVISVLWWGIYWGCLGASLWSEVPLVTPELGRPRESHRPRRRTMARPAPS